MSAFSHKNFLGVAVAALLASAAATAQSNEDAISRCASIASVEDRIDCLEEALRQPTDRGAQEDTAPHEVVEAVPEVDDEVLHATAEEPAEPPVVEADDMLSVAAEEIPKEIVVAPIVQSGSIASAVAPAESGEVAADEPAAESPTEESAAPELGAEQLTERATPKNTRIQATVVDFELVGTGRLRFTLDNGQVWQQTGDDDAGINRKLRHYETVPAEMWQARSGGYRIYLTPIDRTVRVRRLK